MPDIRDVLNALDDKDRILYSHLRTTMRSEYLNSIHEVLHIRNYTAEDDAFMDLIDIKLAILFDRAGKFKHEQGSIDEAQAAEIESQIVEAAIHIKTEPMTQSQRVLKDYAPNGETPKQAWN